MFETLFVYTQIRVQGARILTKGHLSCKENKGTNRTGVIP
jgi:hypothetical protein